MNKDLVKTLVITGVGLLLKTEFDGYYNPHYGKYKGHSCVPGIARFNDGSVLSCNGRILRPFPGMK